MKVKILGSGPTDPIIGGNRSGRLGSSILLDDSILIDATPSISKQLAVGKVDIKAILITHAHIGCIAGLKQAHRYSTLSSIPVYANETTLKWIVRRLGRIKNVEYYKISDGEKFKIGDVIAMPIEVEHSVLQQKFDPTCAWMINDSILYAPDVDHEFFFSDKSSRLKECIKKSHITILDGSMCVGNSPGHLNIFEASKFLSRNNYKNIYFIQAGNCADYELLSADIKKLSDTYHICSDGMELVISAEKYVTKEFVEGKASLDDRAELIQNISEYDPSQLDTDVLKDDFRIALAWYSSKKQGKDMKYSQEEIENLLQLIMEELIKRGIEFHPDEMKPDAKEAYDKVYNRIRTQKLMENRIPEFVDEFQDAVIIKDFISLVGSSTETDAYHDIDVLVRMNKPNDFIKRAIETRLSKMLSEDISDKLHFIYGDSEGPHDTFIPLYDLKLASISQKKLITMGENQIEPMDPFFPMKPKKRFYKIDEAIKYLFG